MVVPTIMCRVCARVTNRGRGVWKCEAFPGRIPDDILLGKAEHTRTMLGDHGLMFKPIRKPEAGE